MSNKGNFFFELYNSNGWLIFILFFTFSHVLFYLDFEFVDTDLVYAEYLEEISQKKYNKYNDFVADFVADLAELDLDDQEGITIPWENLFWDSVIIIIGFIFSVPIVAGLFLVGFMFDRKFESITYPDIFKVTMIANFVFLLSSVLSLFWFMVVQTDYDMYDLIAFNPMYLISYFDKDSLPNWSLGVLNLINIYEVLFVFVSAYGLSVIYPFTFRNILSRISIFYVLGLLFWKIIWIYIGSALG